MSSVQTDPVGQIEYSLLCPRTTVEDLNRMTLAAVNDGAVAVRTAGVYTSRVKRMLAGTRSISVVAAVAYPNGSSKSTIKAIEATAAIKDGADEIDIVPHLPNYLAGNLTGARDELLEIVRAARACRRDVKINVVLDGSLFRRPVERDRLIEVACQSVREGACDGVVIPGDPLDFVRLVKPHAYELTIKATLDEPKSTEQMRLLLEAGADRISIDAGPPPSV